MEKEFHLDLTKKKMAVENQKEINK